MGSTLRAKLKAMATEEQKSALDESSSESQSDRELFSDEAHDGDPKTGSLAFETHEQLSEHDIFSGDEDFYKLLADSTQDTAAKLPVGARQSSPKSIRRKRFSALQKAIAASIVVIVSMLVYVLLKSALGPVAGSTSISTEQIVPVGQQTPASKPSVTDSAQAVQEQIQKPEPVLSPTQPLSLKVARSFYLQKDYDKAYAAYNQLRQALPASEELLRDFLQLKMGLCSNEIADFEQASRLFAMVSQSRSPAVRIMANYHLSLLEIQRKRYLRARTRAYNTIALIKTVDFDDDDWALSFECDCYFLVAECLTRHILLLSNVDADLPDDLWGSPTASLDPFGRLSEAELRRFLNTGSEHLGKGLLDPRIRRLEYESGLPRWSVTSYGAPVEELLAKFAAGADLDTYWDFEGASGSDSGEDALRQRPVSLHLPGATSEQIVLIAAGCAGLLACPEDNPGKQKVTIFDPTKYSSLRRHISFLSEQAISLWQKFVLTFYSDERLGNAHFVMGLLQSQIGLPTEAIAEYKLVANRFSQLSLAPFALLHSSKLKANLRDYHGAREDLKQLVEQYPDTEIYGQAYLRLADATMEAGLNAEAAQLYQRVYNFGLSPESKIASSIGAAGCFYETKAYEDTAKWLTRYINLAGDDENNNLYSAYFLLGQTNLALGKYEQACNAFQYALAEQSSREQYIEAITALVKGHMEQEHFVEALDTLENVRSVALSQEQSVEMLLLRSRIFRMLGLVDSAIVSLRDRAEYVSDSQLNAKISFELAQCHIAKGNLERARSGLSGILGVIEPGLLAQRTALELADVCLKIGRSPQAISVCLQLLDSDVSAQIKQRALKVLAAAYSQQKDYEKAALALSGQWK
ncbi:MAG: tetratricopeptide repeat protein [Planctomycetota bacterium]|jgi:tetratricopeptide (TPR) repeat protein